MPKDLSNCCVHQFFKQQARRTPQAIAVTFGDASLTYRELDQRADRLARRLIQLGAVGTLIGLCVEPSLELVVSVLGILKAGAAYVPLNPVHPKQRLTTILNDASVSMIVTQRGLAHLLPETSLTHVYLGASEPWDRVPAEDGSTDDTELEVSVSLDSLAYVIFTSGSTGGPKGCMINHRHLTHLFASTLEYFQFTADDVWTLFHSFAFDFSVWEIWGALLTGARLVVVPRQTCQSTSEFYDLVRREHVTVLNQTPGAFQKFIQVDELRGADLSLRVVIMSGENLCLPMLEPWFALHGDERPQLFNVYGITETTVFVTCQPLRATDRDPPTGSVIGKPFSGWQVFLFDEEHRPVADGELGEIYVGGAGVGVGYRNKPDLTRERFLSGTCFGLPNNRLYKSGDLARRLPNGDLVYAGRADHQVKIRGFRVELTEIQTVLARHPAIRDVAVVACADGTGIKQVVAYVVARGDMPPIRELHEFIGSQLPPYMIPALIVPLESLPLTVNGKVDRERLPPPFTKTSASSESTQPHLEGRQEQLRRLWERLLPVKSFGIDDNFFELGGNSLLGMQLCLEIEKELGVVVTPNTLVQQPTIRRLEEALDLGPLSAAASPMVCLQPKGHLSPFFCVHPIGGDVICFRLLSNYLGTDRPFYGLSVPKFSGHWESHTRIEDMAANYLTALQKIQPEGPYYLGGYSMGVYIALEMAQQLRASGRQVAFLGVLDDGPALLYQRLAWGPYAWARLLVNLPSWLRYDVYDKSFGELFAELSRKWRVLRRRMAFYQKSTVVDLEAILDISAFGQYQQKLIASHYQALLAYRPRPYAGEITLFRAKSQPLLTPCPYDLGWSALTVQPSNLKIHRVPGNHLTILTEPYIRVLAARLSTALADHTLSS